MKNMIEYKFLIKKKAHLFNLAQDSTDSLNSRTFKPSYFEIWSKHVLDEDIGGVKKPAWFSLPS